MQRATRPHRRITVRDGVLTIVDCGSARVHEIGALQSGMGCGGVAARRLAEAGTYLADVYELDTRGGFPVPGEIHVRFLADGDGVPDAKDLISEWAGSVGRARVWFDDEVREPIKPDPGIATVECPYCTQSWAENDAEFWRGVYASGQFPSTCLVCGGALPQWKVEA